MRGPIESETTWPVRSTSMQELMAIGRGFCAMMTGEFTQAMSHISATKKRQKTFVFLIRTTKISPYFRLADKRIVIKEVEWLLGANNEASDDFARPHFLHGICDDTQFNQVNEAIGKHLRVNTQMLMICQLGQDSVRDRTNAYSDNMPIATRACRFEPWMNNENEPICMVAPSGTSSSAIYFPICCSTSLILRAFNSCSGWGPCIRTLILLTWILASPRVNGMWGFTWPTGMVILNFVITYQRWIWHFEWQNVWHQHWDRERKIRAYREGWCWR